KVIVLTPDCRNYIKCRDLKWPVHDVLAQYEEKRNTKCERFGDTSSPEDFGGMFTNFKWGKQPPSAWEGSYMHRYSALELTALPTPSSIPWNDEREQVPFGMIVNENRAYVSNSRLEVMKRYVLPWTQDFP